MEKKFLHIEIICAGKSTIPSLHISHKDLYLNFENQEYIIPTALSRVFEFDIMCRKFKVSPLAIKYNKIVHLLIKYDSILILDTRETKYEKFISLLKFNNTKGSRRRYLHMIMYLSQINRSTLVIDSLSNEQNQEINKLIQNSNNDSLDDIIQYSDYQIALLCKGMLESTPRELGVSYFENNSWSQSDRILALNYLTEAKKKYGNTFIDFCLKLPQKPIHITNVELLFSQFEKINKKSNTIIRVLLDDKTEVELVYQNDKIVMQQNQHTISSMNRSGKIEVLNKDISISATIFLYFNLSLDPLSQVLFFGSVTGKCSFCGLPLDNPISIKHGYGKICADNNNLPWV